MLLGRHMYDEWSRYWPTSDEQPFADFINGVKKYVVTSTPLTAEWGDSEAVGGELADIVRDLKALPGKDIGVHGSIELAQSLLAEGLVDELDLAVAPVLDPEGRRLFDRPSRAPATHPRERDPDRQRRPLARLPPGRPLTQRPVDPVAAHRPLRLRRQDRPVALV